jgi:glutamate transport system permease protein
VAETVRSGINTVSRGQAEAARAIGLTFPQTLGLVVLPQALRTVVAPLGSLFIALIKNSSIATVISVQELVFRTDSLANETARGIPVYVGAAIAYLLLTIPSGAAVSWLERRVAIKR